MTAVREGTGLTLRRGLIEHELDGAIRVELDCNGYCCSIVVPRHM